MKPPMKNFCVRHCVLWSDLFVYGNTARVSLIDAATCINLISESVFNIVISCVFFSHCDFLLRKPHCISYA